MGSSTTKPEATVAILTKDAGPGFDSLLAKIDSQTYRRRCDILVIDSGSRDGTVETARRSGARLIHIAPGEFGHGKTRNLAARRAHGRYLCFLSQDARPGNEHWLANLVGACQRTGVAGAYSRQVPRRESSPMERYFLATRYPAVGHVRAPRPGSPLRMADIHFSNRGSCLKRALLLEHPYREDLPLAEDQCWARDMLLKGHSVVYEPTSCIVHSHDYSLRGVYRKWHLVGRAFSAIGEEESSVRRFLTSGLGYVAKEMGYLVTHRPWWIPYALLYDMLKFAGYRAGKRAARGAQ